MIRKTPSMPLDIPGYQGGPYSDHREWLDQHVFWVSYLAHFFHGDDLDELLLGADYDAAMQFSRNVYEAADWPVFIVPISGRRVVYVIYRTLRDDAGLDVMVHHPDELRAECAASTERLPPSPR